MARRWRNCRRVYSWHCTRGHWVVLALSQEQDFTSSSNDCNLCDTYVFFRSAATQISVYPHVVCLPVAGGILADLVFNVVWCGVVSYMIFYQLPLSADYSIMLLAWTVVVRLSWIDTGLGSIIEMLREE